MKLVFAVLFFAVLFLALTGLMPLVSLRVVPVQSSEPTVLSKEEIADRAEAALRNAVYLEVTTITRESSGVEGSAVVFEAITKSKMAKDAVLTYEYERTQDGDKLLMALSVLNGRCQEYRPNSKRRPIFEFDSLYPHAPDRLVENQENDCYASSHFASWVGVPADRSDFRQASIDMAYKMRIKIDRGIQVADAVVNGHDCYVFYEKHEEFENTTYFDKRTYFVVRWNSIQHNPEVGRDRVNDIVVLDKVPDGVRWKIEAEPKPEVQTPTAEEKE